ncbi:MAG TPA: hypothetical protein VLL73_03225 [Desulfurivibrionaceae bacterium]|nr:hypothetical protein [Desulfurivibrionaceae bacterium]
MECIEHKELPSGMVVTIHDVSKQVAGDRWLVKIRCEATIPVPQECVDEQVEEDATLKAAVLAKMGERLTFVVSKERNFVDDREKDEVLAGMVANVRENMLSYLANPLFPARLFASHYEEERANCLVERHYQALPQADDEEDGPADFSALFRKE